MSPKAKSAITIGNFDGVHRGHRALVEAISNWKRSQGPNDETKTIVMTFDPHPIEVLRPGVTVPRLTTTAEKIRLLQNLGVDEVKVIPFTPDFSRTPAREFFESVLLKDLHVGFLAVGHNFYFGHNREGTPGKVVDWSEELGITAELVNPIESDGGPISSSRIRQLIEGGQMVPVSRLLGRDYSVTGEVAHGDKRGRQLGFPTANIYPQVTGSGRPCLPAKGVYLSSATVEGKTFASITNVGVKPTVANNSGLVIETHLLDYNGDLYGKLMTVEFRDRLRDEKKFNSLDELRLQIQSDTTLAKTRLSLK